VGHGRVWRVASKHLCCSFSWRGGRFTPACHVNSTSISDVSYGSPRLTYKLKIGEASVQWFLFASCRAGLKLEGIQRGRSDPDTYTKSRRSFPGGNRSR
jgi:hypothetical protein